MKNKIFTILLMGVFALFSISSFAQSGESQSGAVPKSGNEVVKKVKQEKIEKDDKGRTIIKSNKKTIKNDVDNTLDEIKTDGENTMTTGENTVVKGAPKVDKEKAKLDKKVKEKKENTANDFGQETAKLARLKEMEKKKQLKVAIKNGNEKVVQAKERIKVAKEKLSLEKKNMTEDAYNEKAQKIEKAELYIKKLEEKLSSAGAVKQ